MAKAPFPEKERRTLARAYRSLGPGHNICLSRKKDWVTNDGRFATELEIDGELSGTLAERNQVHRIICRFITLQGVWEKGNPNDLKFRSKRRLKCLQNLPAGGLAQEDRALLGITSSPKGPVLLACAKGCARLIGSGRAATPDGKKEAQIIIEAAANADPQLAKKFAQSVSGPTTKPNPTRWPVANPTVTSGFGPRQIRLPGASKFHDAVDFRAAVGVAIFSTEDGVVFSIGYNARAGNHFFISNHDGTMSSYSHTSPLPGLAVGQKVKAGQQIGTSDGTGNITKPHLHYTYRPGTLANPATPGSAKVNPLTTQFAGMSYAVVP